MTTFLLNSGPGSLRRVAHLARFDAYGSVAGTWCWRNRWNLQSNVPWGQPRCRDCLKAYSDGAS